MMPGSDCVGCHATTAGAPPLLFGGTLYRELHEADDCTGVEGTRVRVTDNDGNVFNAVTNEAGNFYVLADAGSLVAPNRAVLFGPDGGIRAMVSPQDAVSCNGCHTVQGNSAAPGRMQSP